MLKKKKIFIVGDSTACTYPHCGNGNAFPRTGWGQVIDRFLPEYTIVNLALSGRSSKSFKTEECFQYLKDNISKNDYLIIQFGHNDEKINDPQRYTEPNSEYKQSLMEYVDIARRKYAVPILATSISRNRYSDTIHEKYVSSVRELANDEVIPLMDMYKATNDYINKAGCADSIKLFMNLAKHDERFMSDPRYKGSCYHESFVTDNTHLNINGALFIANIAADMIHDILKN